MRQRIRHQLQWAGYRTLVGLLRGLPQAASRPLGRAAGQLVWSLSGTLRRLAQENLALALPERPAAARRRIARNAFRQLGASVFDTFSSLRFRPEELLARIEVEGWEHLETAQGRGRGVFLMGAHWGCWEIACDLLAMRASPIHVISDRLSNPRFDGELRRLRARFGVETIDLTGGAREINKTLTRGGKVMIALDIRTRREDAIAVRFFDRLSLTSPIPAFVAIKIGAPVVPVFALLTDRGYRVEIEPPIWPQGEGKRAIAALTERYLGAIEARIRARPEQWIWMYRRWRPEWDDPAQLGSSFALRPGEDEG